MRTRVEDCHPEAVRKNQPVAYSRLTLTLLPSSANERVPRPADSISAARAHRSHALARPRDQRLLRVRPADGAARDHPGARPDAGHGRLAGVGVHAHVVGDPAGRRLRGGSYGSALAGLGRHCAHRCGRRADGPRTELPDAGLAADGGWRRSAIFHPVSAAMVGASAPASSRGRWLGLYVTAGNFGLAVGPWMAATVVREGDL